MKFNLTDLSECNVKYRIAFFKEISFNKFQQIFKDYTELASILISDLLVVQDYTDVEVSFGSDISLEKVRSIINGESKALNTDEQFTLIDFYFRVFVKYAEKILPRKNFIKEVL